jgi:S1-C subfamily serine protease
VSIGHPFGVDYSVGVGVISKVFTQGHVTIVQSSAMIHPGNSGGPLILLKNHKVVGVNQSIYSPNGIGIGIGFAISAKNCLKFIEETERSVLASQKGK